MRTLIIILLTSVTFNVIGQSVTGQSAKDNSSDSTTLLTYEMKYPKEALRNRIQGTVEIKATFDAECNIVKKTIVKSLGYGCDEEALNALKNIEQRVKKIKGQKCNEGEEVTYPFHFKLD
jgi:TonB family protein